MRRLTIILLISFFSLGKKHNASYRDNLSSASTEADEETIQNSTNIMARLYAYRGDVIWGQLLSRCLFRNLLCPIWTIYPTPNIEVFLGFSFGVVWWPFGLNRARIEQEGFFALVWDFADFVVTNCLGFEYWYLEKPIYVPCFYLFAYKDLGFLNVYLFDLISLVRSFYLTQKRDYQQSERLQIKSGLFFLEGLIFSFRISVDCAYFFRNKNEFENIWYIE